MANNISALTVLLFGISAFIAGVYNLLTPDVGLVNMNLPSTALPAYYGNASAAIAMGVYYTLAAYQRNKAFFILTVPTRSLTATIFWSQGGIWRVAAAWEGGGALLTGLALLYGV